MSRRHICYVYYYYDSQVGEVDHSADVLAPRRTFLMRYHNNRRLAERFKVRRYVRYVRYFSHNVRTVRIRHFAVG